MEDEMTGTEDILCFCRQDEEETPTRRSVAVGVLQVLTIAFGITVISFLAAVGLLSLWVTAELNA